MRRQAKNVASEPDQGRWSDASPVLHLWILSKDLHARQMRCDRRRPSGNARVAAQQEPVPAPRQSKRPLQAPPGRHDAEDARRDFLSGAREPSYSLLVVKINLSRIA